MAKRETPHSPIDKMAEQLANRVVDRFASVDKWKKTWLETSTLNAPFNAQTGEHYKGYNAISLLLSALDQGFEDPRWMTYKQAKDGNMQVKKGSKGSTIGFFNVTPVTDQSLVPRGMHLSAANREILLQAFSPRGIKTYGDLRQQDRPGDFVANLTGNPYLGKRIDSILHEIAQGQAADVVFRSYTVFNGQQIEGMPEYIPASAPEDIGRIHTAERIIDNSGVFIDIGRGRNPAYALGIDTITMPSPEQFTSVYGYYAAFLHELSHASGHPERNNRDMSQAGYAREELIAEFATMLITTRTGLKMDNAHFDNHAAYLKGWSQAISNNPRELFNVIREAAKAAEYVAGLAEQPDRHMNPLRLAFNEKNQSQDFHNTKNAILMLLEKEKISARSATEGITTARMEKSNKHIDLECGL